MFKLREAFANVSGGASRKGDSRRGSKLAGNVNTSRPAKSKLAGNVNNSKFPTSRRRASRLAGNV